MDRAERISGSAAAWARTSLATARSASRRSRLENLQGVLGVAREGADQEDGGESRQEPGALAGHERERRTKRAIGAAKQRSATARFGGPRERSRRNLHLDHSDDRALFLDGAGQREAAGSGPCDLDLVDARAAFRSIRLDRRAQTRRPGRRAASRRVPGGGARLRSPLSCEKVEASSRIPCVATTRAGADPGSRAFHPARSACRPFSLGISNFETASVRARSRTTSYALVPDLPRLPALGGEQRVGQADGQGRRDRQADSEARAA